VETDFKTGALNHSATRPSEKTNNVHRLRTYANIAGGLPPQAVPTSADRARYHDERKPARAAVIAVSNAGGQRGRLRVLESPGPMGTAIVGGFRLVRLCHSFRIMPAELLTGFDAGFAGVAELTIPAMRDYAQRHAMLFTAATFEPAERPPAWSKIPAIRNALDRGSDPVIWIDCDALIVRPKPDIRTGLDPAKHVFIRICPTKRGVSANSGVMVLRNTAWSRWFLDAVWNYDIEPEHPAWENAAIAELLGFRARLGRGADEPNEAVLNNIGSLDDRWNYVLLAGGGVHHPFVRHYAGVPQASRLTLIRRDMSLRFGRDRLMPIITKAELSLAELERRMDAKAGRASTSAAGWYYLSRRYLAKASRQIIAPR
jgi:hypothetical protein